MKHFKNNDNKIFAYDNDISKEVLEAQIKKLLLTEISDDELSFFKKPTIEELKKRKISEIKKSCEREITNGFYSEALGEKHFYHSTIAEQSNLSALVALGVDNTFKSQRVIVVEENEVLEERVMQNYTFEQLKDVLIDCVKHISTQINRKDKIKKTIHQASTAEELAKIEW